MVVTAQQEHQEIVAQQVVVEPMRLGQMAVLEVAVLAALELHLQLPVQALLVRVAVAVEHYLALMLVAQEAQEAAVLEVLETTTLEHRVLPTQAVAAAVWETGFHQDRLALAVQA